jgi:hypothetical protein
MDGISGKGMSPADKASALDAIRGRVITTGILAIVAVYYTATDAHIALQMLEQSWDGLCTHSKQGWNVGRPPYGYLAQLIPHPVPAKAAEGKTKSRVNTDHDRFPPPVALNPNFRDRHSWSRSGLREAEES